MKLFKFQPRIKPATVLAVLIVGTAVGVSVKLLADPQADAKKPPARLEQPASQPLEADAETEALAPKAANVVVHPSWRNLFRPLIAREREPIVEPIEVGALPPGPGDGDLKPEELKGPVIDDLAMAGIIETADGAEVLLVNSETGDSVYLSKGQEWLGFTVKEIAVDRVVLTQEGKEYTLVLGAKLSEDEEGSDEDPSDVSGRSSRRSGGGPRARRSERSGSGSEGGSPISELFKVESPQDKLKKLEEIKDRIDPKQYERFKKLFEKLAAEN